MERWAMQSWVMRSGVIILLAGLACCSGTPADYGITGPGSRVAAPKPVDVSSPTHDISLPYAIPNTGNGRYWGYN